MFIIEYFKLFVLNNLIYGLIYTLLIIIVNFLIVIEDKFIDFKILKILN